MNSKITCEHLRRGAAVYIRQSTPVQVLENTESQRRQYGLVEAAKAAGFASVAVIDDDLGRSGSGVADRPRVPEAGRRGVCRIGRRGILYRGVQARAQLHRVASAA